MKGSNIKAWYPLVHGNKKRRNNLVVIGIGKKYGK